MGDVRPSTITRPRVDPFTISLMSLGKLQEPFARNLCQLILRALYKDVEMYQSGLWVHKKWSWLGASPDSIIKIGNLWYLMECKCKQGQHMSSINNQPGYYTQCVAQMECVQSQTTITIQGCFFFQVNCRTGEWMLELIGPNDRWFSLLIDQTLMIADLQQKGQIYHITNKDKRQWAEEWDKISECIPGMAHSNWGQMMSQSLFPQGIVLGLYNQWLSGNEQVRLDIEKCLIRTGFDNESHQDDQ